MPSTLQIPQAKLPSINLPAIRSIPSIPGVGCVGASGSSYLGQQFGNVPDVLAAAHLRALIKAYTDQIFALIKGELSDVPRAIAYAAKAAELAQYVIDLTTELNQVIGDVVGEVTGTINFVNSKIEEVNTAASLIEAIPQEARSKLQNLALSRYNEYLQELNQQIARLQSTVTCIGGI